MKPKEAKRNGLLMVVGSANPARERQQRALKKYLASVKAQTRAVEGAVASRNAPKGLVREYTVPLGRAPEVPGGAQAVAGYQRFHGAAPTRVRIFEYDDGHEEVTERALFKVGTAEIEIDTVEDAHGHEVRIKPLRIGTVYAVPTKARSNKAGKQWVHSHREDGGKPPIHAVDPQTGILQQLGGTYEVRDWIRR
jgi:hypothetical protein